MSRQKTIEIIALGLALVIAAPTVAIAEAGKGPRHSFEELDVNNDGQITEDEMATHRATRFAEADTDGDGALSRDELLARGKARTERRVTRMLERHDTDGDGKLTMAELKNGHHGKGRHFERVDTDGNGAISRAEFDTMRKAHGKHKSRPKSE